MKPFTVVALVFAVACGSKSGDGAARKAPPETPPDDAAISTRPERTVITGVEIKVVDPSNSEAREVYERILAQRIGATLVDSDWFIKQGTEAPQFQLRTAAVEVVVGYSVVSEGSEGKPAVIAVVEAAVRYTDGGGGMEPQMNVLAERAYSNDERKLLDGLVAEHVERAVSDAAAGLIVKERIRVGMPEESIAALDSPDLDVRTWALAVIGHRKIDDAFEAVMARLDSDAEEERDAAIGALLAFDDPRAVAPLTRLADFNDYALMRRVIDAVAALGGDEARDYLDFVSTGHPDDQIKAQAKQALHRLGTRSPQPTP
jgi:hypothetical protein